MPACHDVRMRGFRERATVEQALQWLDAQFSSDQVERSAWKESVEVVRAAGRVLGEDVVSEVNVPSFARGMMDGFAVRAGDTVGAGDFGQVVLPIVGEALPGRAWEGQLGTRQAVKIMTGAPLPAGADAVLPVELTEWDERRVTVLAEVPPGKNVGRCGEDIVQGAKVLEAGRRLRPQDIGVLCSIGVSHVTVVRTVQVRVVVTGDELLPPGARPVGHRIVDSNSPMLSALVARDGGVVTCADILPDDPRAIEEAMRADADVVLVSGGSSVGAEDHAPRILAEQGNLAIHGISMRPSSPTGMGRWGNRYIFLLPGNPVSCLCAYDFFAGRLIRRLAGRDSTWPYASVRLPLARKLVSMVGRVDYARVVVANGKVEPLAISGASMLSSTTRADGFVIVPADSEGSPPGADVDVYLYD